MSSLRCYAGGAHIPDTVPIHVEENGWPTSPPARSYDQQAQSLETQVRTFQDFRGTYNVSDYRWFDLRDSDSTSPNPQQQYGLMTDTYTEKPAFARYRDLITQLSVRSTPRTPANHRRLKLRVRCRHGRWLAWARGPATGVKRVDFRVDGRLRARDRRPPFRRLLRSSHKGRHVVAARVHLRTRTYRLARRVHACARTATPAR
jgi:hypothetical protein